MIENGGKRGGLGMVGMRMPRFYFTSRSGIIGSDVRQSRGVITKSGQFS